MKKRVLSMLILGTMLLPGCQASNGAKPPNQNILEQTSPAAGQTGTAIDVSCSLSLNQEKIQSNLSRVTFHTCAGATFSLVIPEGYTYNISDAREYYNLLITDRENRYRFDLSIDFKRQESLEEFKNLIMESYGEKVNVQPWRTEGYMVDYYQHNEDIIKRDVPREHDGGEWILKGFLYPLPEKYDGKFVSMSIGSTFRTLESSSEMEKIIESFQLES